MADLRLGGPWVRAAAPGGDGSDGQPGSFDLSFTGDLTARFNEGRICWQRGGDVHFIHIFGDPYANPDTVFGAAFISNGASPPTGTVTLPDDDWGLGFTEVRSAGA